MFSWIQVQEDVVYEYWLSSASEVLALAPPTPGTEQHGGKARGDLFVCFEVGEGRQANEKLI